jgi:hypothetical protein
MAAGSRKGVGGLICAVGAVTSASGRGLDIGLGTWAWRAEGMRGRCGALDAAGTRAGRDAAGTRWMRQGRGRQNVHRMGVWTPTLGL